MAAQNSRDRKKAKMDELECEVKELRKKNAVLLKQCENLQSEKQQLVEENLELRRKLADNQTCSVGCNPCVAGPAVSNTDPQLQGQGLQLALGLVMMVLVSLRFRTYLENWRVMNALLNSVSLQTVGFGKLLMSWLVSNAGKERLPWDAEKEVLLKWWGRHQRTWNPVEDCLQTQETVQ
ncbi:X-box-binding protein 1 isoform X2 [Anabrus simplex]